MICSLYNDRLERIAILGTLRSLVWCESYAEAGVSQMVVVKNDEYAAKIKTGYFIGLDNSDTLQVITQVTDKGGQLWVYMRECKWILSDRIYDGTFRCGVVESSLKNAVTDTRLYDIVKTATDTGLSEKIGTERTYNSLYDISCAVCGAVGYGFKLRHERAEKMLYYEVYNGADRTDVKFSEKFGNMRNAVITLSDLDWKNVAYVGGAGEGSERIFVTVGETGTTGFDRREMYVDARDIQPIEGESEAAYQAKLEARGLEKLAERRRVEGIEFEINPAGYGGRFTLGDKVTAVIPERGMIITVRITGIKRKYENNMESLSMILGDPVIRRNY